MPEQGSTKRCTADLSLVVLPDRTAGGLARNPVSGAEMTCSVGDKHFYYQPPPAEKAWVRGQLVPLHGGLQSSVTRRY
jgi:hypothetical protein